LNRAPTLHRLGVQAFQPILVEGKAIQLHPLVCMAFNADFDGDQMAVHIPLTEAAKLETREIMKSTKNLLKPATGHSIVTPTKDMAWGVYYVTLEKETDGEPFYFSCLAEAKVAYDLRKINLRQPINIRIIDKELKVKCKGQKMLKTTLGRILFNNLLPDKIPFYNQEIDKKKLAEIVQKCLELYDFENVAKILDDIKDFSFKQLTKSGYSWGMMDLPIVPEKKDIINEGDREVEKIQEQYEEGLLTFDERYSKIIQTWTLVKERIAAISQKYLDKEGSVYTMISSGARGSWAQLIQMIGMKGLVINPAGQIIELPVKASFKEGFNVLEYYISAHGTRKGLTDTALRTANSGYLTRRLVDVAQDVVVLEEDCHDSQGIVINKKQTEEIGQKFSDRLVGRFATETIKHPKTKKVIVKKGELITSALASQIEKSDIQEVRVRSVLSCQLRKGVCQKCYGYDLAYNKLVKLGTSVGIIAAQSIGEPGTQLTMRTFHTGGVAGVDITQGLPRVEEIFEARTPKKKALISDVEGTVSIEEIPRVIQSPSGKIITKTAFAEKIIKICYISRGKEVYHFSDKKKIKLRVKDSQHILAGTTLFINERKQRVKNKQSGIVHLTDKKLEIISEQEKIKEYMVPAGTVLYVKDGDYVYPGDQLTEGCLDLSQLYSLKGKSAVQQYILNEIQKIYVSQGQRLNDKHIEIIIRQMFSRVYVKDAGDTDLLEGEIIEKADFIEANEKLKASQKKAIAEEVLLGISRVALTTGSFLSAASFQETARVLINAALTVRPDKLEGLKENVIIGRLIPAGTGFEYHRRRHHKSSAKKS